MRQRTQSVIIVLLLAAIGVIGAILTLELRSTAQSGANVIIRETGAPAQGEQNTPAIPQQTSLPNADAVVIQPPDVATATPDPNIQPTATPPDVAANDVAAPVTGGEARSAVGTPEGWNPPALEVPLARHPFDHYWFIRPVGANYTNYALDHYSYGSDGAANDLRIHHGVDIANDTGVEAFAAGSGTVIWAGEGHSNEFEEITSYGNTVVIEHDFGHEGRPLYTLYAHLSVILVEEQQRVEAGDVIGLIGATGLVSGPHIHFEVRVGRNSYFDVRNPLLWMAPYVGTGTVAGRLEFPNGDPVQDVAVVLRSPVTNRIMYRTTTYAGFGVPADDNWNENFVLPDVQTGEYIVEAREGGIVWEAEIEVLEGLTNWVDLTPEQAQETITPAPLPTSTP